MPSSSKRRRDDFIEEDEEAEDDEGGYGADDISDQLEEEEAEMRDDETDEDASAAKKKAKGKKVIESAKPMNSKSRGQSVQAGLSKKKAKAKHDPDDDGDVAEETKPVLSEEEKPAPKARTKPSSKANKVPATTKDSKAEGGANVEILQNEEGDSYIQLGKSRRITVRQYNKVTLVDIREYYTDKSTGTEKPGKKGISLPVEDWHILASGAEGIGKLVAALEKK